MPEKEVVSRAKGKYQYWLTREGLLLIEGWARDGLTDEQIAAKMKICRDTLNEWKKKYSVISDTLKRGKEVVDREVENALLKRALGYKYTEKKIKKCSNGTVETTTTIKKVIPDVTAQIFWLKNRKPKDWRDKVVVADESDLERLDELIGSIDRLAGGKA